jgi:hypothetical protein
MWSGSGGWPHGAVKCAMGDEWEDIFVLRKTGERQRGRNRLVGPAVGKARDLALPNLKSS